MAEHLAEKDIPAEEFEQGMFSGLNTTKPNFTRRMGGDVNMSARIDGGTLSRSINFKTGMASHDYFAMNASKTGGGTAKKLLAGQVALYQKLGLKGVAVHANIDVGGYAWAKYGFVPSQSSWYDLQGDLENKIAGGGSSDYEASSWDEMSSSAQSEAEDQFVRSGMDEELRYQEENWRDNDARVVARDQLVNDHQVWKDRADQRAPADAGLEWMTDALDEVRESRQENGQPDIPYTDTQLLKAMTLSSDSGWDGRKNDLDFDDDKLKEPSNLPPPEQGTLPGIEAAKPEGQLTTEMRDQISKTMLDAFEDKARDVADDLDPPSWLADGARESLDDYWSSMSDRDRFQWVRRNTNLAEEHEPSEPELNIPDPAARSAIEKLVHSDNPKAIWAIADSKYGKDLLLGTDWSGQLNLRDPQTMTRFNDYVSKAAPARQAAA